MNRKPFRFTACVLSLLMLNGCGKKLPSLEDEGSGSDEQQSVYHIVYYGEITTLNYIQTDIEVDYALCSNLVDNLIDYDKYGNDEAAEWTSQMRRINSSKNKIAELDEEIKKVKSQD